MAVTFDRATGKTGAGVESLTWSHLTATQSNLVLLVGVSWLDLSTSGISISSITYNGVNLSFLASATQSGNSELWYLVNPSTGTNNAVITWGGAGIGEGGANVSAGVATFYGVSQSTPLGTAQTKTGSTSPITVNVTGTSSGNFVMDNAQAFRGNTTMTLTVGGGHTQMWNAFGGSSPNQETGASARAAGGGTITMSWTESTNRSWSTCAVEILQSTAATGGNNQLMMEGVGT